MLFPNIIFLWSQYFPEVKVVIVVEISDIFQESEFYWLAVRNISNVGERYFFGYCRYYFIQCICTNTCCVRVHSVFMSVWERWGMRSKYFPTCTHRLYNTSSYLNRKMVTSKFLYSALNCFFFSSLAVTQMFTDFAYS